MRQLESITRKWAQSSLILRILGGLVIGAILGLTIPGLTGISLLGTIFVGALKAIAPLLVFVLVTASVAQAGAGLGARFRTVIGLYLVSTLGAAVVAAAGSKFFPITLRLTDVAEGSAPSALADVFSNLLSNLVANPLASIAQANYIGILFWSILMGLGLRTLASRETIRMVSDFSAVLSKMVTWIIQFAPFGILGLVFSAVSESGMEIFSTYGKLVLLLVGCMLFNTLILNPLWAFLAIRSNPYPLLWTCLRESAVHAFFTRSSAANIPINMQLCKKMGIDEDFYSVSIPLGATVNMNGAAVTITVMTLAVAHTIGVPVSLPTAILLSIVATLGACGASGIAGGSLLLIPLACSFLGIGNDIAMQAVAVGFIIGVVQDSVETALNSSADVFFTATAEKRDRRARR
ncbi:MAG TPA: serine/threonine transporter SstT [Rikenellaceae bacterium]|nr:serine/threonine transporter SstT [Rikenellaceae bacterium]